ncbi:glycosyl hydrolase, partial [Escherichia coli]|nr:glycosyl hydrolase [Escherichia coli]
MPDKSALLARQPSLPLRRGGTAAITVDPGQRYQRMVGFGAAITDASAWLIQHRLDPRQRGALLRELFGNEGLGFAFTRLTIGA